MTIIDMWKVLKPKQPMRCQGREDVAGLGAQRYSHKKPAEGGKLCNPLWVFRRKECRAWDVADTAEAPGKPVSLPSGNGPGDHRSVYLTEVRPGHARVGSQGALLISQPPLSLFQTITLQGVFFF